MKALIPFFQCPSAPENKRVTCCCGGVPGIEVGGETNYVGIRSIKESMPYDQFEHGEGVLNHNGWVKIGEITDGTSQTLAITKSDKDPSDPWKLTAGANYCPNAQCNFGFMWAAGNVVVTQWGINATPIHAVQTPPYSYHPGGANFAFADGHCASLPKTSTERFSKHTTRAGGEPVDTSAYSPATYWPATRSFHDTAHHHLPHSWIGDSGGLGVGRGFDAGSRRRQPGPRTGLAPRVVRRPLSDRPAGPRSSCSIAPRTKASCSSSTSRGRGDSAPA